MMLLIIIHYFFGGGIGGYAGGNDALTFSLDFGKEINPTFDIGTKLTMSMTKNAPDYIDIPFYYWGDPGEYPEEYFASYRERNEVSAQFVARKYLKNFILMASSGLAMQEYVILPVQDSLEALPLYPLGETEKYYLVFGAGMGIKMGKFDLCLTYSNRFGALFYVTRRFGPPGTQKPDDEGSK